MIAILIIITLLLLTLFFAKRRMASKFKNKVTILFAQSSSISNKHFYKSQLEGLPPPVKRYFNHVLTEGQPYISYARMKHVGQFKAGKKKGWMNIVGEQYATTEKPGFIWKGTTALFEAKDMYICYRGRLTVTLLSLYNIIDAKGKKQYNSGELLRWLGESVLYPTNFLPSDRLQWLPIDENKAKLTFQYKGLSLFFIVTFNAIGEIIEMETQRYMDEEIVATWVIKASQYKQFNQTTVPTVFDVMWRLDEGDFSYAKFHMTTIEYDIPHQF